jgi:hypothetical protein
MGKANKVVWGGKYYWVEKDGGYSYYDRGTNYIEVRYELKRQRIGAYKNQQHVETLSGRPTKAQVAALIEKAKEMDANEPARLEAEKAAEQAKVDAQNVVVELVKKSFVTTTQSEAEYSNQGRYVTIVGMLENGVTVQLTVNAKAEVHVSKYVLPGVSDDNSEGMGLVAQLAKLKIS